MKCKDMKANKWIGWGALLLGVVSFAYGLISYLFFQTGDSATNTLMGMFTGFGFGIICVAIGYTIRTKRASQKQLEQEEIERNDERNIMILRTACTIGMFAGILTFAVFAFVLMAMGYRTPSLMCVGGIYVMELTMLIARKVLETKM